MKCLSCTSKKIGIVGNIVVDNKAYSDKSTLVYCMNCQLYWTTPLPNEKTLGKIYNQVYHYDSNTLRDFLAARLNGRDLKADKELIYTYKNSGKILDIGAGRGDLLSLFDKKLWERWAFDPFFSKEEIRFLKQRIGEHINDFNTLKKYPHKSFDVVVLRNVIEHTATFSELLNDISKLLKKDGFLIIRTPNMDSVDFKSFKTKWYEVRMPGHLVFFNKSSIAYALKKSGFNTIYNKGVSRSYLMSFARSSNLAVSFPILFFLSVIFSMLSPLFGEGGDLRTVAQKAR